MDAVEMEFDARIGPRGGRSADLGLIGERGRFDRVVES